MVKVSKLGLFVGEFRHNLTERNRLALPKRIRVEVDGFEVVLSRGFERYIAGFDRLQWQQMVKQELSIPFHESRGRELRRQIFSSVMIVELDSQGRVVLPEPLLAWAGLKGKVGEPLVIIGAGDHFEIWEETAWIKNQEHKINT